MIFVYGDESMDEKKERVCAVAAVVGTEAMWMALEERWLARTKGIPFHAKDCDTNPGRGDYANCSHEENTGLYRDLTQLLVDSQVMGFASTYDIAAQREVFPLPFEPPVYYQPFVDVLEHMFRFAGRQEEIAKFTFDSRVESEHNAGLLYAHLREDNPNWRDRFADEISFVSSRSSPRVQVADLFAREAMKALDNQVGPVKRQIRGSWKALRETNRFVVRNYSTDYFQNLKDALPNLYDVFGFIPQDFHDWLKSQNRQLNVTAYIEFLRSQRKQLAPDQVKRLNALLEGHPQL